MNLVDVIDDELDALKRRRVPCIVTYLHPFRLVEAKDQKPWVATIGQINNHSWDYVALHELVGGLDVGLQNPYHLVVGRDGALALPPIEELRSTQAAVEFFNRCLAGLLLGGVYCEAINPDGLDLGSIIDWKYIRTHKSGPAAPNRFHNDIRHRLASPLDAIALEEPRQVELSKLQGAMKVGLRVLNALPLVRGEYLLKGTTGLARLDWGTALSNLWIVVEQLVSELWERTIVIPTSEVDKSKMRLSQLKDTRSWTASNKIEMLYQKAVIDLETLCTLGTARKARNVLHHLGQHPASDAAWAAYKGIAGLLMAALDGERPPLFDLDLENHALIDPFEPPRPLRSEPKYWMEIPKLPGEAELEQAEARAFRAAERTRPEKQMGAGD